MNVIITAAIILCFWIYNVFLDLTWYFCNHIVLIKLCCMSLASQMRIYSLPVTWNLLWHRLIKSHFIQHYTFQHCSDTFKLNNHVKCLNLTMNSQSTWIESNLSLPTGTKAYKLIALLFTFSAISSFP